MSHQLETIIGYKFKNPELLEIALTHTSYANESRTPVKHNERLEFLGDSVLQIVSADYLFHAYADRPEGDLTRIRASLVSEGALFQFAQEIDLGEYLRLGRGEERCGGRTRPSVVISGACSLEEPHPKFHSATMMSPFCTFFISSPSPSSFHKMGEICSRKVSPARVRRIRFPWRSNSSTCSSFSRDATARLMEGWETRSAWAALEIFSYFAAYRKYFNW